MSDRPLVASAAGGSISSLLFWLVREGLNTPIAVPGPISPTIDLDCPTCDFEYPKADFWSGLLLGFLIWPLIELVILIKQWATLTLRNRITSLGQEPRLYKVLHG